MELKFKKFLSLVLTFTLLLSFFNGVSFKYSAFNAYASIDEDMEDAAVDEASISFKAGDWKQAARDGCAPNFFHNAVQNYLSDTMNGYGYGKEKRINYNQLVENPVTKIKSSYGSADVYKEIDADTFYVWEVKPYSYNNSENAKLALKQLANYTNTELHSALEPTYLIGGKDEPLEKNTKFTKYTTTGAKYQISFWSPVQYDGLILYTFQRLKNNDAEEEEESNSNDNTGENDNSNNNSFEISEEEKVKLELALLLDTFWWIIYRHFNGGSGNSSGSGDSSGSGSNNKPIEQSQGGKKEGKVAIGVATIGFVVTGAAVILPIMAGDKYTSLRGWKAILGSVESTAAFIMANGTVVHAESGDYYELTDNEANRERIKTIEDAEEILKILDYDEESYDPEAGDDEELEEKIKEKNDEYEKAKKQTPPRDPLIIHFGKEEKIVLTSLDNGVNFDLDNNGFGETTAWIGTEEGFLAYDLNNNTRIDNGGELFGDKFLMSNGKISSNGFEALASLNENEDLVISKDDTSFSQLSVWFDRNHNGKTEDGELNSLTDLGIVSIGFVPESDGTVHVDSNVLEAESALVTFSDNTTKSISEFWFPVDTVNTTHEGISTIGNVPNLGNELEKDEEGRLTALFNAFRTETNIVKKRYYLKHILYYITGADDIALNSRGGNIDARELHVIEQFMGDEFDGVDGKNPNSIAAETLKNVYSSIEDTYYNYVNFLTEFAVFRFYTYVKATENGDKYINYDKVNEIFDAGIENGFNVDVTMYDYGKYLIYLDIKHGTNAFAEFKNKYSSVSTHYAEVLSLIDNTRTIIGSENSEELYGTNFNDIIFGEGGNDNLIGNTGNDLIYSNSGNDIMCGGFGNDSYYFSLFHGEDIINDTEGNNTIVFIDGLSADDFNTSISMNGKFILTNKYTGDIITLNDFISNPLNYDFASYDKLQTIGGGDARELIEGTEGDDELDASDGFNIFYGRDGEDTIYGGENIDFMYGGNDDDILLGRNGTNIMFGEDGNDTIEDGEHSSYLNGGTGNDILKSAGGNDVLDGGSGDDFLNGERGDDTYIFAKGYDSDTVAASVGHDTIIIHNYRISDMNNIREANRDLTINFGKDTDDKIIITNFFGSVDGRSFSFVFDDGTVLEGEDITAKTAPIYGTDGNETINGTSEDDTIDSGAGDDYLCGCDGEDTYIFGKGYGNDIISEWGSDLSFVEFKDIKSDEITISVDSSQSLVISINDTGDSIKFGSWSWSSSTYTLIFADGAEGYVYRDTNELVLTKGPDPVEEDIAESGAGGSEVSDNSVEETDVTEQEIYEAA